MNRARVLFVIGFILSMGAGVVVGMALVRNVPGAHAESHGWDADLGLTPQQAEQVKAIWSAVRQSDGSRNDNRRALGHERDEAIAQLIPAERKADYDRILQTHATKVAEANKEHDRLMQEGEQKMKAVLTEAQWKKFESIKKDRAERWRNGRPSTTRNSQHSHEPPGGLPPAGSPARSAPAGSGGAGK